MSHGAARESSPVLRGVVIDAAAVVLSRPRARVPVPSAVEPRREVEVESLIEHAREQGVEEGRALEVKQAREQRESAIEAARAEAQREGFAQGIEEGRREAAARAEVDAAALAQATSARLSRLDGILSSASEAVPAWRAGAVDDIVALAHEVASRIVGEQVLRPAVLREMTLHVLREHGARKPLAVHVNPADLERISASGIEGVAWEWVADPAVDSGVLLRSPQGGLDARLSTQLRAVTEALLEQRRTARATGSIPEVDA